MRSFRQVLVELLLFESGGYGHPQDGAMPSFFPDSRVSILGFLLMHNLLQNFFGKALKIQKPQKGPNIWKTLYVYQSLSNFLK